ncbi:N-succinylarginine dihydrolase [Neptuniibacter sp. PT34_22]|uniref:N-succinylarginine dihydrolase n=1 Tax=Neptuniibacter sp. PT34_22 TaxID=3398205 RepID=UPI0039F609AD
MSLTLNLDGLVAPNHHYAGLAQGNLASQQHQGEISSPKDAALQGLEKMWMLHQLGIPQGIIPPPMRPDLALLYAAGFRGSDEQLLDQAWHKAPQLLTACYSASAMWAANSATCSASQDTRDRHLHFTPANLNSSIHRSLETKHNYQFFQTCFDDHDRFSIHVPLPSQSIFADEGAANQIRLNSPCDQDALNLFIYGREGSLNASTRFPARQTRLASESIIRQHQLEQNRSILIQQNPIAIDHGAFHNDVVAVGHLNFLFLHEQAFKEQNEVLNNLRLKSCHWQDALKIFEVSSSKLSLQEAVSTYLFNSQLIQKSDGSLLLLAPMESKLSTNASAVCEELIAADNPISEVQFVDLTQSMQNGGGPACLRLAVPITVEELSAMHQGILLTPALYESLKHWIGSHYRDRLSLEDLRDPRLISEIHSALSHLGELLKLPSFYN